MLETAEQIYSISSEQTRIVSVDCRGFLDTGETLSGTPTITEIRTTDLVLSDKAVSTTALDILGASVATGKAVQFKVDAAGVVDGRLYKVKILCATSGTQTVGGIVLLQA